MQPLFFVTQRFAKFLHRETQSLHAQFWEKILV